MIDVNKLDVTKAEILAAAKVLYEADPIRSDYGYYLKWDELPHPFQKVKYMTLARRAIRAAKGAEVKEGEAA